MLIFFNVKEAREFLLRNGMVLTLRSSPRPNGKCTIVQGSYKNWKKLGEGQIEYLGPVAYPHQLNDKYQLSGFDSPKAWMDAAAAEMVKGPREDALLYLYRVSIRPEQRGMLGLEPHEKEG